MLNATPKYVYLGNSNIVSPIGEKNKNSVKLMWTSSHMTTQPHVKNYAPSYVKLKNIRLYV